MPETDTEFIEASQEEEADPRGNDSAEVRHERETPGRALDLPEAMFPGETRKLLHGRPSIRWLCGLPSYRSKNSGWRNCCRSPDRDRTAFARSRGRSRRNMRTIDSVFGVVRTSRPPGFRIRRTSSMKPSGWLRCSYTSEATTLSTDPVRNGRPASAVAAR